jgi:hypothetical protein
MIKITIGIFLCVMLSLASVYAQESTGELPYSFTNTLPKSVVQSKVMTTLNGDALRKNSKANAALGKPLHLGKLLSANFNLLNSGSWVTLKNGDRIWRLEIQVPGALATSLYYDDFYLPEGAKFHVYSKDKEYFIGAFTQKNNPKDKLFATETIFSSACVVEYYEPAHVKGLGRVAISSINHMFIIPDFVSKAANRTKGFGDGGACMINVNCPEGANWQNQKRASVQLQMKVGPDIFGCSSTLLNNTAQNDKPYVLTAEHCGVGASVLILKLIN